MSDVSQLLYKGKAKSLYRTDNIHYLIVDFRDDTSAFDGEVSEKLSNKGRVNNQFNAFVMELLEKKGVPTHFERTISDHESLVKHLEMLPIECVVRNVAAGSLCKRLGVASGYEFSTPLFEFFYKNDALKDPLITEEHIQAFGWAQEIEIAEMKRLSLKVNEILRPVFAEAGMVLVDFKLEYGRFGDQLLLGDEFTPDGCRLWDIHTQEKMDKDRFRQQMGGVVESYQKAASRLGIEIEL